jgi:Fur family transcriptional regulator, ferric uptake regulator
LATPIVEHARERVRATGLRVTGARVRVLAALMQAGEALSHSELQRRLEQAGTFEVLDRVTLYRVLEWLVEHGLAHRVADSERIWRFSVDADPHHSHGHFKCRSCERMFCMKASDSLDRGVQSMLPPGFAGEEVELTVVGRCADCGAPAQHPGRGADARPMRRRDAEKP